MYIDGYDRVRGEYDRVQTKLKGRMLLVLPGEKIIFQIHGLRERKRGM